MLPVRARHGQNERVVADVVVLCAPFTSFDEEMKGAEPVQSTFLVDMDKLFDAALAVPEISGIILNPWNRTIQLDKTLIRIIKGA